MRTKEFYIKALHAGRFVTVASEDDFTPSIFWANENDAGEKVVFAFNPAFGTIQHPESVEVLAQHFVDCETEDNCVVIVGGWVH